MIKAIIFDLNGVFIQSEPLSKRAAEKFGVSEDEFWEVLKAGLKVARQPGADNAFSLWQPGLKKLGMNISEEEFYKLWLSGESVVSEFIEYAKELRKKGIRVFMLSNNFRERTEYYRKNFSEIFENTDKAYFSWETGLVKPAPEAYENIFKEHDLVAAEVIYFDDSEENIRVAGGLGIDAQKFADLDKTKEYIDNKI